MSSSKISELDLGGLPVAGDRFLIARNGDNYAIDGGLIVNTEALSIFSDSVTSHLDSHDASISGLQSNVATVQSNVASVQGQISGLTTSATAAGAQANAAYAQANSALLAAQTAFQTVSPIKAKNLSGITGTFSAPPNWSVTFAGAGSSTGANLTSAAVIPFYCDKNVLITGLNLITPNTTNSVIARQAIYMFDPVNFTLGSVVYAGKPLTAAASSRALLTDTSSGVLAAGWYAYVLGYSSATAINFTGVVGGVSMFRDIYGYSNGAGTSLATFTVPTTATEVTTSGFSANAATPLTNYGSYYTPLMNWSYTTDAPRAFV